MRNRSVRSRQLLSAQWSSDLFLWAGRLGPWPDPAVRPVAGRNSNAEASNVPHFQTRNRALTVIPVRRRRTPPDRLNDRSGTRIWQASASLQAFRDVAANWQQESRNPPAGGGFGLRDAGR